MNSNGVYFGKIHSYNDLNLLLAPFVPTPATPKTNYVEVPGGHGTLDLTEAHGEVKYNDRDFTFTFTIDPSETLTFDEKITQVSNAINGLRCKITLDRDSGYYWIGRCSVEKYAQDKNLGQIEIKAKVYPYKFKNAETKVSVVLDGTEQSVVLTNSKRTVIPTIICTESVTIMFEGDIYELNAGENRNADVYLTEGETTIQILGSGTVIFAYQEAEL